jgi:mannose-6-phosphate isomerase
VTGPAPARTVAKPWGEERVFADGGAGYAAKLIRIHAGQSTSLQYHETKDETICLILGVADVEYGPRGGPPETARLRPCDALWLPAGMVHRVSAVTEILYAEASTAGPGWAEDVVRLEDAYGRV